MAFLNEQEKQSLIASIKHAESGTEAEIVTVIAEASDGYRYIPTLWASNLCPIHNGCTLYKFLCFLD